MLPNAYATVTDLLDEKNLWPWTLLEEHLALALNLRSCSLITIPANLPDTDSISRRIDEKCISNSSQLMKETNTKKRLKLIRSAKEKLRSTYDEEIKASPSYTSHLAWTRRLGLELFEVEVRPTIREHFLYSKKDTRKRIENLTRKRVAFREEYMKRSHPSTPRIVAAYPEERFPEYLNEIGQLLGYPQCCIKAYIEGREEGSLTAEKRASSQIENLLPLGVEPDMFVYFSEDFIPCSPTCSKASDIGRRFHQTFTALDDRLSAFHIQCLRHNVERVASYIRTIEAHQERIQARLRELGIESRRKQD